MALPTGSKAPDFNLKSKTPEGMVNVQLSDNFGKSKTVLLFVPAAFTGVCTKELCEISEGMNVYSDLGAKVYGISIDSPFALAVWAERDGITIPLLSDYQREVINAYDVVLADLAGLGPSGARAAFVIDEQGTIIYSEQVATLELPNFDAIKAVLSA